MKLEVTPLALEHAPWSISKASCADICPKQFEFKYILKAAQGPQASASQVGTVSHKILELRAGGVSAKQAETAALAETPLTTQEQEDLHTLKEAIDIFLRDFDAFCKKNGVIEVYREKKWGLDVEGNAVDFFSPKVFFRGVLDLGCLTKEHDLIVMDHKSGFAKDIQKDQKFRRQLNSYAVMGLANIEGLQGARGMINFLQGPVDKRRQWLEYVPAEKIGKLLTPWLYGHICFCAEKLVPPFVAKPRLDKFPCAYCSYRPVCGAYKELERAAEI
jgi:hypothetical protein